MVIPFAIAVLWLAAAVLNALASAWVLAAVCVIVAPVALLLTRHVRRFGTRLAAVAYLKQQAAKGIARDEALQRIHELAPDGASFDTDDVPSWPFLAIGLCALAGIAALVQAAIAA